MKTFINSPFGLKPAGVGPKIFKWVTLVIISGILTGAFFPKISAFPLNFIKQINTAGWFCMVSGIVLWICAVVQFVVGFPKGKLITTGVYSLSRNPIYASWIIFILPGLAVICNNWIYLLAAFVMYFVLINLITEEEKALTEIFGVKYTEYAEKVNRVLFFPPIYNY